MAHNGWSSFRKIVESHHLSVLLFLCKLVLKFLCISVVDYWFCYFLKWTSGLLGSFGSQWRMDIEGQRSIGYNLLWSKELLVLKYKALWIKTTITIIIYIVLLSLDMILLIGWNSILKLRIDGSKDRLGVVGMRNISILLKVHSKNKWIWINLTSNHTYHFNHHQSIITFIWNCATPNLF